MKKLLARLERMRALDKVADPLRDAVAAVAGRARIEDALHGTWLGHPLHPAVVQFPVGAWLSASLLDLLPGNRRGATFLLAAGTVAALPAAATGAVDWSGLSATQRRVGLVHATANTAALALFTASIAARLGGRHRRGQMLSLAGLGIAGASAFLGGHLSFAQSAGVNYGAAALPLAPMDWQDIGALAEFQDGVATARTVDEVPVIVYRNGSRATVLIGRCAHFGGPLHEGPTKEIDGELCIECPWHGSRFRLADGIAVHGPTAADQPMLDARVVNGRLEVRQP
jgi:nitrite reductase/ring-hydroxylating ferredoxin subunit